jgi:hypothetical protein
MNYLRMGALKKYTLGYILFLMASMIGGMILYVFDPEKTNIFIKCMFFSYTGYYCPSCGLTRALHKLLHFEVLNAIRYNVFSILVVIIFVWINYYFVNCLILKRKCEMEIKLGINFLKGFVAFTVLYTIFRNIDIIPFKYLAP